MTVEIDPAMGNAFQEAAAHIKFVFSAEDNELPPPPLERDNHDSYIAGYPDGTVAPGRPITRPICRAASSLPLVLYTMISPRSGEDTL